MLPIQTHIFDNGCCLIYEKTDLPLSSIQIYQQFGSIHEPPNLRASAHMIEHMVFKGCSKYEKSTTISDIYDKIGAEVNAYTEKSYTCYYVKCGYQYTQQALEPLGEMLFSSVFNKKDYELEHAVVIEENTLAVNDTDELESNEIERLLFNGTIYDSPIDNIAYHTKKSLDRETVFQLYKNVYIPQNTICSIVSHHPFKTIVHMLQNTRFTKSHIKQSPTFYIERQCAQQQNLFPISCISIPLEAVRISLGFRTCPYNHPDRYILNLIKSFLSDGMNSFLFNELREKHGFTYSSEIEVNYYKTVGSFILYTEIDKTKTKQVLPILKQILKNLYHKGMTYSQIKHTKQELKGRQILRLNNIDLSGKQNALAIINATNAVPLSIVPLSIVPLSTVPLSIVPLSTIFEQKYAPITKEDVLRVCQTYFAPNLLKGCLVGKDLPTTHSIHSLFS